MALPIHLDTREEQDDFLTALLFAKATYASEVADLTRNLSAYGDRPWAAAKAAQLPILRNRVAVLNKVIKQIMGTNS